MSFGLLILAFFVAALATGASIPWLRRAGAIADENHRTLHIGQIPKGGGLPVLASVIVALYLTGAPFDGLVLALALALALVSFVNDLRSLPTLLRLAAQIAAATVVAISMPGTSQLLAGLVPLWLDRLIIILGLVWMMNLYNFMDGINGIAGAETIAICTGFLAVTAVAGVVSPMSSLATAILGATAGFLVWNLRSHAKVFLGDAGSVPLGFLMGVLMIEVAIAASWAAALILPGIFIADATLTLVRRALAGEKFWEPHKSHVYQRATERLGAHLPVVAMISAANVCLIFIALWAVSAPLLAIALAVITIAALFAFLNRAEQSQSRDIDP